MAERPRGVLLTDLDNTIYNWVDFYGPAFRALLSTVMKCTGIRDEAAVISQFKAVYLRHGSLEYPFAVEELELCKGRDEKEVQTLTTEATAAFWHAARLHLATYPHVDYVLERLRRENIAVVAVTNAPLHEVRRRLDQLGLLGKLSGLVAMEWFRPRARRTLKIRLVDLPGLSNRSVRRCWRVGKDSLKPSTAAYQLVLDQLQLAPGRAWVVGDSVERDLQPGLQLGAKGLWARYGQQYRRENLETLLAITPWPDPTKAMKSDRADVANVAPIDDFLEVLDHLPVQLELPLGAEWLFASRSTTRSSVGPNDADSTDGR